MKRALSVVVLSLCCSSVVEAEEDPSSCSGKSIWEDNACDTPRRGVLSGGYLAAGAGFTTARPEARDRIGIGGGGAIEVRLGLAFWDLLVAEFTANYLGFKDLRPTSEQVVDCTRYGSSDPVCEDGVRTQKSTVSATVLGFQLGLQHRFRPSEKLSLVPGAMLGYVTSPKGAKREVNCVGCPSGQELDLDIDAFSIEPFLRFTFTPQGWYGVILRSRWFLTGDLMQQTTLAMEVGLP